MVRRTNFAHASLGVVALEEEQRQIDSATGTGDTVVEVPVENNAESAETDIIDIIEENAAADQLMDTIEDSTDALIAVESFISSMKLAVESGGLDKINAQAMRGAVSYAYKRAGFKDYDTARAFPALEGFGQTGPRVRATNTALEEAQSRFQKIWTSILEAIKKAVAWIKEKFLQIFGAAEKLKKRAEALVQRAADNGSGTAASATIESDRVAAALFVGGSVPNNAAALTTSVIAAADVVYDKISTAVDKDAGVWIEKLGSLKSVDELQVGAFAAPAGLDKIADPAKEGLQTPPAGVTLYRSKELPGGKAVLVRLATSALKGDAAAVAIRNMGGTVDKFSSNVKAPADKKVQTLSTEEIGKLAQAVSTLMDKIIARREVATELTTLGNKITEAANKASGEAEKDEPKVATVKSQIATGLVRLLGHPAEDFTRYAVNDFAKAALDYCELSMKQYGKGGAAPAAAEPAADAGGKKPAKK